MTNLEYQGFWIRFTAWLLDGLIIYIPVWIFSRILVWYTGIDSISYVINLALVVIVIYMVGTKGGTPGKLILGIKIVNEEGEYIGVPLAILRYIGKILSFILFFIGYIMIAWDAKKQGLHDKIVGSYVVKG